MGNKTRPTRLYGRLLATALLPLLLVVAWWLHDSLAFVRITPDTGAPIFWPTSQATLNLRVGCPPTNPLTEYGPCWNDAARDAAQQWNAVGANFTFRIQSPSQPVDPSCDTPDSINTVVWADTQCGMAFGDATLAVTQNWFRTTGELIDSDVHFNSNKGWTTYSGPQRSYAIDFHRVALHEFGHVLGLDHPDDHGQSVNAIMNSRADDTDRLQADDIAGIRAIYSGGGGGGQPDPNYCRDFGPCPAGKGDCDSNSECQAGLVCVNDVGAQYGLPAHYDVCEAGGARPDPDYCVSNYCGIGDGDCDPGQCNEGVCVNDVGARYGLPAHYDVCEAGGSRPDPDYCVDRSCGVGEGDCDPGQCALGLVCSNDVGARYGLPAHYDVCEAGGSRPDPDYCVDRSCGVGEGDCDPGQCALGLVCSNDVGARYGLPAHYDVCEAGGSRPDPDYCVSNYCGIGDGDCDPGQCDQGVCVNDVGARYGLPAYYDVCEARAGGSSLNDLLGTWRFTYTLINTFAQTYRLSRVDTSTGTPLIVGTDEYGNPVIAGRIQDISPGNSLSYEFSLLELSDFLICRFFIFDKTGSNSVEGLYFQIRVRNGECSTNASDISTPYPMTGIRTSRSILSVQEQSTPQATHLAQRKAERESLEESIAQGLSSPNEADNTAIRDLIDTLSPELDR